MKRINRSASAKGRKKITTSKQKCVDTEQENNRTRWKQVRFLSALGAPSAMGDSDDVREKVEGSKWCHLRTIDRDFIPAYGCTNGEAADSNKNPRGERKEGEPTWSG